MGEGEKILSFLFDFDFWILFIWIRGISNIDGHVCVLSSSGVRLYRVVCTIIIIGHAAYTYT